MNFDNQKSLFKLIGLLFLAALITFATHYGALDNMATSFDDNQYLINNPLVKNPSMDSALRFLKEVTNPSTVGGYYQPLTMISLMLDYKMSGGIDSFFVFHLHSLILHIINVMLVILILNSLFKNKYMAFICGILYGTHPLTVEVISWIGERKTPLAAMFSFLCILFYIQYRQKEKRLYNYLSIIALIISLLAKPIGVFVPVALVLIDIWPLGIIKTPSFFISLLNRILSKYMYFTVFAISMWITVKSQSTSGELKSVQLIDMFYKFCCATYYYISKIIFPTKLSPHQPIPDPLNLDNLSVIVAVVVTLVIFFGLFASLKKTKSIFIGYMIYLVIIFPVMGIKEFNDVIGSDKFVYLSGIGLLFILCNFFIYLFESYLLLVAKTKKIVLPVSIIIPLIIEGLLISNTLSYTEKWQNTITHYTHLLEIAPSAVHLNFDLAVEYSKIGEYKKSIHAYKQLIASKEKNKGKNMAVIYTNIGVNYYQLGDNENAMKSFEDALKEDPGDVKVLNNLAKMYRARGAFELAIQNLKSATISLRSYYEKMTSMNEIEKRNFGNPYNSIDELTFDLFNTYKLTGQIYLDMKDYKNASEYLKASLTMSSQIGYFDLDLEKSILNFLYETGDYVTGEEKAKTLITQFPQDTFLIEYQKKILQKKIEAIQASEKLMN